MTTRSFRESHLHKGFDYHQAFLSFSHRATIWRLEQRILLDLVQCNFLSERPRYLDFGCGTGRILGYLSSYCRSAVGVDVSASMLDIARSRGIAAEIIHADITRNDSLCKREFDLITAFRFFPNAECELRKAALRALVLHLSKEGVLVFNNHKNAGSLRERLGSAKRWMRRHSAAARQGRLMSDSDVRNLVSEAGLAIDQVYHLAVLPLSDHRMWFPQPMIVAIEGVLSRIRLLRPLAQNVIYVCHRVR